MRPCDCALLEIRTQKGTTASIPGGFTRAHRPYRGGCQRGGLPGGVLRDGYGQIGSSSLRVLQATMASKGHLASERGIPSLASARLPALLRSGWLDHWLWRGVSALPPSAPCVAASLPVPQLCLRQTSAQPRSAQVSPAGRQLATSFASQASQHPHPGHTHSPTQRQPACPRRAQPTPCTCTQPEQPANRSPSPVGPVRQSGGPSRPPATQSTQAIVHPPLSVHPSTSSAAQLAQL